MFGPFLFGEGASRSNLGNLGLDKFAGSKFEQHSRLANVGPEGVERMERGIILVPQPRTAFGLPMDPDLRRDDDLNQRCLHELDHLLDHALRLLRIIE